MSQVVNIKEYIAEHGFTTQNGKKEEELLGLITALDLVGYIDN